MLTQEGIKVEKARAAQDAGIKAHGKAVQIGLLTPFLAVSGCTIGAAVSFGVTFAHRLALWWAP